ncbi:MAG TPA: sulfatase-like hydrolase/transferase [Verrucomicrobiota bacterium]|nr:sulfatase-like hydrolase/transferase [Verrucomicrobiota bacterium]
MRSSRLIAGLLAVCIMADLAKAAEPAKRPNFVFIVSEDNSVHYLRLYGHKLGATPNIERLAAEGLTFNHAFSAAPVCSVARTTLATGMHAPRVGFQYHRKSAVAHLPPGVRPWSATLREHGYYATNNAKTDYNIAVDMKLAWDKSSRKASWRNRPNKVMPFFHMQSFADSHESSLHFPLKQMESPTTTPPGEVELPPYFPDTPIFRYTMARYFDRMRVIDGRVGRIVSQLKEDGLLEDTFVFYFGDHGGVLPRSKGYAYESGLHVPFVVRIPENFKHLVDHKRGSRTDGFVSFIDFGPTVLHLAGLEPHGQLDGTAFLGADVSAADLAKRDEVFGHADRFDEKYDMVRTLRKGNWKYIRNYQNYYADGLQNNYRYRQLAYDNWRDEYRAKQLNATQQQFFERRPAEQLFDLTTDPHEVNNLAVDPKHAARLAKLRTRLKAKVKSINDLSFYPENRMVADALDDGVAFGREHAQQISRLAELADLAVVSFAEARRKLSQALRSKGNLRRYWALTVCASFGEQAKPLAKAAKPLLNDNDPMVRMRAAEFLGGIHAADPMPTLYDVLNSVETEQEVMLTFNTVVYLRDQIGHKYDPSKLNLKFDKGEVHRRVNYLDGTDSRTSY